MLLNLESPLYVPDMSALLDILIANIFSKSLACLFISFTGAFFRIKSFNLDEVQFISFSFYRLFLVSTLGTLYLALSPEIIFFSKSFIVLPFTFKSVIRFKLIFI